MIITGLTTVDDVKNLRNSLYDELWLGDTWAVPTNIYYIIWLLIKNTQFKYCIVIVKKDEIRTIFSKKLLYYCIQYLLNNRLHFQVQYYKIANELSGSLSWKKLINNDYHVIK